MIDYRVLGRRIRQYRQEKGITQEELAFRISTSPSYVSNIERGIKKPSLQKLSEIADILQITVNDLIYSTYSSNNSVFDKDLQYMMSLCTPEKQRAITKSIAEILQTLLSE